MGGGLRAKPCNMRTHITLFRTIGLTFTHNWDVRVEGGGDNGDMTVCQAV